MSAHGFQFGGLVGLTGDGPGLQAHRARKLQRQMPQATESEHSHTFARFGIRIAQATHHGVARTENRRRRFVAEPLGQQRTTGSPGQHELGISATEVYPRLRFGAGILVA